MSLLNGWIKNYPFIITLPDMNSFLREKDPVLIFSKSRRVIPAISECDRGSSQEI